MKAFLYMTLLSIAPACAFAKCGPARSSGELTKPAVISVSTVAGDAPAFYLSPAGRRVTLYFNPDDLLGRLRADLAAKPGLTASQAEVTAHLLEALEADLPLTRPLDARKYAQQGGGLYWRFEHLAADLMAEGKVLVDEDPPGEADNPATIVMVSESKGGKERGRWFCTARGKELLAVDFFDE